MKPAHEWDENYIMSLPIGEIDWLEAKGRKGIDLTLQGIKEGKVLDDLKSCGGSSLHERRLLDTSVSPHQTG